MSMENVKENSEQDEVQEGCGFVGMRKTCI